MSLCVDKLPPAIQRLLVERQSLRFWLDNTQLIEFLGLSVMSRFEGLLDTFLARSTEGKLCVKELKQTLQKANGFLTGSIFCHLAGDIPYKEFHEKSDVDIFCPIETANKVLYYLVKAGGQQSVSLPFPWVNTEWLNSENTDPEESDEEVSRYPVQTFLTRNVLFGSMVFQVIGIKGKRGLCRGKQLTLDHINNFDLAIVKNYYNGEVLHFSPEFVAKKEYLSKSKSFDSDRVKKYTKRRFVLKQQ